MLLLILGNLAQIPGPRKPSGIIARAMNARPTRIAPSLRAGLLLAACVVVAFLAALKHRQDANWDLQNYHFYDPWAWLSGRLLDWDIAAAQLQTFHNPLPDLPFYALVAAGVDPRTITAWLALPTGVAAYFAIRIAWRLFGDRPSGARRRHRRGDRDRLHGRHGRRAIGEHHERMARHRIRDGRVVAAAAVRRRGRKRASRDRGAACPAPAPTCGRTCRRALSNCVD